jgi:hypothetical protein
MSLVPATAVFHISRLLLTQAISEVGDGGQLYTLCTISRVNRHTEEKRATANLGADRGVSGIAYVMRFYSRACPRSTPASVVRFQKSNDG